MLRRFGSLCRRSDSEGSSAGALTMRLMHSVLAAFLPRLRARDEHLVKHGRAVVGRQAARERVDGRADDIIGLGESPGCRRAAGQTDEIDPDRQGTGRPGQAGVGIVVETDPRGGQQVWTETNEP